MNDLIAYLGARWAEEEATAKAARWAGDERWAVLAGQEQPFRRPWQVVDATYEEGLVVVQPHAADDEGVAKHVALWEPLRILAEVDVKRRMLEWLHPVDRTGMAGILLRTLAVPYADRDDFRPEWRL